MLKLACTSAAAHLQAAVSRLPPTQALVDSSSPDKGGTQNNKTADKTENRVCPIRSSNPGIIPSFELSSPYAPGLGGWLPSLPRLMRPL